MQVKTAADAAIVMRIANLPGGTELPVKSLRSVAAYVPVGSEPGAVTALDALIDANIEVLLPVVAPGPPAPLRWARYVGPDSLIQGRFGLLEPTGPALPPSAVEKADLVLVPALAVDRDGVRLGRGAGYYDRTIASVHTDRLIGVVYDDELVDELPADRYDVRMGWALTPRAGFTRLGTT